MRTLKEHLYNTVHRNRKPLKAIAEEIGMSENYLTRAALPDQEEAENGSGCRFPLKKLIPLIHATGDFQVLDHIEQTLGRVAFPIPQAKGSMQNLVRLSLGSVKEFGELMAFMEEGIADGRLSQKEREKIQKEGYEAIQAITALLEAVKVSEEKG